MDVGCEREDQRSGMITWKDGAIDFSEAERQVGVDSGIFHGSERVLFHIP